MSGHTASLRSYYAVFLALMVLTGVTVAVASVDLGVWNPIVALLVAGTKALLVLYFFMHLKYESKIHWLFAGLGFFWLIVLLGMTLGDYFGRDNAYIDVKIQHAPPAQERTSEGMTTSSH